MQRDKPDNTKEIYSRFIARKIIFMIICLAFLAVLLPISASVGGSTHNLTEVFYAIAARFTPMAKSDPYLENVIWHLRLPRIFMGVLAGSGLAISGAVMQGVTRNPLVEPFTIGISSAAAFGASVAIMLGLGFYGTGTYLIILNAFLFALSCALIVFGLTRFKRSSPETLVLAGIALTYFFGSLTAILQFFASEQQLMAMIHWTFGTLSEADWGQIYLVAAILLVSLPLIMMFSWDLNALNAGDETAKSLGIDVSFIRTFSLIISTLITASIICFTGIIGFVGLVAPHLVRFVIGGDHRFLLPSSCIVGSILVVGADIVGRTVMAPIILPIGVVISFVGVPMFLYLMLTRETGYWS
ncbi:MAG: FecCD family ABC transporter permease [Methanotrichaceae archaeon]